jgi:hypothetical protein
MRHIHHQHDTPTAGDGTANCDPRVAYALSSAGCNYQLIPSGDYLLSIELPRERSHTVIITSRTSQVGIREMRCVFACGYASQGPIPAEVMDELLTKNAGYLIGAWEIRDEDETSFAILSAAVAADCPAAELVGVALCVAETADDLEEGLTGDDRF